MNNGLSFKCPSDFQNKDYFDIKIWKPIYIGEYSSIGYCG